MELRRKAFSLLIAMVAPSAALAAPLTVEQCAAHTADIAALDQAGVKALLEKGPAATKASLTKDQREQIRRYLDVLGQMRFRCPNEAPFVTLRAEPPDEPAEAAAATAPIDAGTPGITLPPGVAAAVVAPVAPQKPGGAVPKKAAAPAKVEPGSAKAPALPAPPAPARPKPAPKPKVDDALRPVPPGEQPASKSP